jgi:hypothetical protein
METRYLVVIGCQKEKLALIDKKQKRKILDFINGNSDQYDSVMSIVRKPMNGDTNFRRSGEMMSSDNVYLDYQSDNVIVVPGYDVDCSMFRKDAEYDIIGISTAASVLCCAMSMYSCGCRVRVLKEYCADRKSSNLHAKALDIMNAYMPGCVI